MKVSKATPKTIVEETLVDVICNKCGKTCVTWRHADSIEGIDGLVETEVHGGYGSNVIGDMTSWRFSVCEKCLSEFVASFKIPYEIRNECTFGEYISKDLYEASVKEYDKAMSELEEKYRNQHKPDNES